MSLPFNRDQVRFGDKLLLTSNESIELVFRGMGHDHYVIAAWVDPAPGGTFDAILLQRQVRIPDTPDRPLAAGVVA